MDRDDTRWTGKRGVLSLLDDIEASGDCDCSVYLTPASLEARDFPMTQPAGWPQGSVLGAVLDSVGTSETGAAVFLSGHRAVAIMPPFPLGADLVAEGADAAPMRRLLQSEPTVGVVLLRLGRYAVGVLRGDTLVASKTESRYMKNRHRAGGQSQRRFERSRERLIRELYDKTCQVIGDVFSPYRSSMDHVMLGGERHTLNGLVKRCRRLQDLKGKTLGRLLPVDRPNQRALEGIAREVWKSRVITFARSSADSGH